MAKNFYGALGLIGGTDGDLDNIDGAGLTDQDGAVVITATGTYTYILDDDSGAAESSPDVIEPDANAGTKRWILISQSNQDVSVAAAPVFAGGEFTQPVVGVTPVAGVDLVTKEYVDLSLGSFKAFFLSDTGSGVGSLDFAYPHETGEAESTADNGAGFGVGDNQHIKGWITEALEPGTTTIKAGTIEIHLHAKKGASNQRTTRLYAVLSSVNANGTTNNITIATTEETIELTDTAQPLTIHASFGEDAEINADSRLILDVYANVGSGAAPSVITLYNEGSNDSFWTAPIDSGIWQAHSDKLDDLATTDAAGVELTELTDASETTLHSHAAGGGGTFVDRGDFNTYDWTQATLTTDGTWNDLDLSGIVPAGAKAVSINLLLADDVAGSHFSLRKNGNSNAFVQTPMYTQVGGILNGYTVTVACDANRVIEYYGANVAFATITIVVNGWWT